MQKKHRSTTVLEEILLDLNHHLARLAWLIKEYFFSKKVTRTITENLAEVGLFVTYSFTFAYSYTFCLK